MSANPQGDNPTPVEWQSPRRLRHHQSGLCVRCNRHVEDAIEAGTFKRFGPGAGWWVVHLCYECATPDEKAWPGFEPKDDGRG